VHPPAASEHESVVHGLKSLQMTGGLVHVAKAQMSSVQNLSSIHCELPVQNCAAVTPGTVSSAAAIQPGTTPAINALLIAGGIRM
jgi:hypothetical protein